MICASDCALNYSFTLLQIGALFLWSYVYNIVRISSSKVHRIVNAENFTSSVKSTGEIPDLLQGRSSSLHHALKPELPFAECNGEQKVASTWFIIASLIVGFQFITCMA